MKVHVDAVALDCSDAAMTHLLAGLASRGSRPPDFLALHPSAGHDPGKLLAAARAAGIGTGDGTGALHGGTSCRGVMTGTGMAGGGTGIGCLAIWDPDGDFGSAVAALSEDAAAAAARATRAALERAGRPGEAPDVVWVTAAPGREEAVIAGIEAVVGGSVPILGGSAADETIAGGWSVFGPDGILSEGVAVSVLFPSAPVSPAYRSGYAPAGPSGRVTRAEGRRLAEIDGRPALEVYDGWTGGAIGGREGAPRAILARSTLYPLGRPVEDLAGVPFHLLAHPATACPDGSIELFADIAEGEEICLMSGAAESLVARAGRVADLARRGLPRPDALPAGALVVYCGGCMLSVEARMDEVAQRIDAALGGAPFLGIFTFGEQGPVVGGRNRHGNLMISCLAFASGDGD